MITKEGLTKIVIFMTSGAWVLVLGHSYTCTSICHIVKRHYFFKRIFISTPRNRSDILTIHLLSNDDQNGSKL